MTNRAGIVPSSFFSFSTWISVHVILCVSLVCVPCSFPLGLPLTRTHWLVTLHLSCCALQAEHGPGTAHCRGRSDEECVDVQTARFHPSKNSVPLVKLTHKGVNQRSKDIPELERIPFLSLSGIRLDSSFKSKLKTYLFSSAY